MANSANYLKKAKIIPRAEHHISRKSVDPNALKVLYRLKSCGYEAYLVGGCVRDLLLGHIPKDFDIVTDAKPEEIKAIFRNCRLIGRRFRLAHILFAKNQIIEVATFRSHHNGDDEKAKLCKSGLILRDNVFGSIEDDAWRRDFTINALYYNIKDFSIIDFTDGVKDLTNKKLKIIGEAADRYQEDPVRIIRAVRIAAKLSMQITPNTAKPIQPMAKLLYHVSPSRLFDEVIKLFHTRHAEAVFPMLRKYELFKVLFPETNALLDDKANKNLAKMFTKAFADTDARLNADKSVSPVYLFAFLLWPVVERKAEDLRVEQNMPPMAALHTAARDTLNKQNKITAIPRRLSAAIQDIWYLQYRLLRLQEKIVRRCLATPRFRAGYDLLLLRAFIDKDLQPAADWWTNFQTQSKKQQQKILDNLHSKKA